MKEYLPIEISVIWRPSGTHTIMGPPLSLYTLCWARERQCFKGDAKMMFTTVRGDLGPNRSYRTFYHLIHSFIPIFRRGRENKRKGLRLILDPTFTTWVTSGKLLNELCLRRVSGGSNQYVIYPLGLGALNEYVKGLVPIKIREFLNCEHRNFAASPLPPPPALASYSEFPNSSGRFN